MTEQLTNKSLYDHFPIFEQHEQGREAIDTNDQEVMQAVGELFDQNFIEEDLSIAIKVVGDQLASRISDISYKETRGLLLDFGVQVNPFLEQLYSQTNTEQPNMLANRLAHTLIYTQTRLQENQIHQFMTTAQRSQMHMEFSQRLNPENS